MTDEIPQWAWDEVSKRVPFGIYRTSLGWARYADELRGLAASLIAQREEQPVDPLLIEARELAASQPGAEYHKSEYIAGLHDDQWLVVTLLVGLRRGIELGEAGAA